MKGKIIMSKLLGGIIILLVMFLAGGWYLGQVQSELAETQIRNTALEHQLAVRDSELLSLKEELEKAQPRHFSSLEELKTWLANDNTNESLYSPDNFSCIDFALTLQKCALADGYILSTEVLPVGAHWVNAAVIGDSVYYIEPQEDRIILEKKLEWEQ